MKLTWITLLFFIVQQTYAQDFVSGPYTASSLSSPVVADFTGDGRADVLGLQFGGSGLAKMILQVSNPGPKVEFTLQKPNLPAFFGGLPAAADMDGDGDLDVVAATRFTNDLFLLKNDGAGNFTPDSLGVAGASFLKIADLDKDQDLDIVGMSIADGALLVFVNNGNLKYSTQPLLSNANKLEQMQVGDMNGDQLPDIAVGFYQFSGKQLVIYLNKGNVSFQETTLLSNDFSQIEGMRIEDINNDGRNDLLFISSFNCEGFINQGNAQFQRKKLISGGINRSITTGDFNGDGRKDIVLGKNSTDILWHPNLSNTTLEFGSQTVGSVSPAYSIVSGDLDGDKDLDLVATNGEFWWYENVIPQLVGAGVPETSNWRVFPNPFSTLLNINGLKHTDYQINITNGAGITVYTANTCTGSIDLSHIPAGEYFLQITDNTSGEKQQIPLIKIQ